jgi:hypothetical protein
MNAWGLVIEPSRPTLGLFFLGQVTVVLRLLAGTESRFHFRLFHPTTLPAKRNRTVFLAGLFLATIREWRNGV